MGHISETREQDRTGLEQASVHQQQWHDVETYVMTRTYLRRPGDVSDLVRSLLLRLRATNSRDASEGRSSGGQTWTESEMAAVFPEVFLHTVEQNETQLWIVTDSLIRRKLRRRNPQPESHDRFNTKGDRLLETGSNALERLKGGREALRGYYDRLQRGEASNGGFWAYLQVCVSNAIADAFRSMRIPDKLRESSDALVDDHCGEEPSTGQRIVKDIRFHAERSLIRLQKPEERQRTLTAIRAFAEEGARDGDRSCRIFLEFFEWMVEGAGGSEPTQAEFARVKGYPQGTVNSAMDRFRARFKRGPGRKIIAPDLYTTHGGSIS